MLASSAFVLAALTMTGVYMKGQNVESKDDGYTLDFTALENNADDKMQEISEYNEEHLLKEEENIPTDTAVLYVGNHRSFFDVVLTYVRVPRPTGYVAKKEMLKWPLLNIWMKDLHCLFLDRQDIKAGLKTILQAIEKAKNGISICIFPEGTRNKTKDTFLPFHEGSFKIAEKAGVPIIPMTIVNSAAIFEDHFPKIKKATVVIEYGKPIYMKDLDKETRKSMGTYVQNIISETYFKNKELI